MPWPGSWRQVCGSKESETWGRAVVGVVSGAGTLGTWMLGEGRPVLSE